jgi:hypothetical protein
MSPLQPLLRQACSMKRMDLAVVVARYTEVARLDEEADRLIDDSRSSEALADGIP